jgi:hypothetical protein
MHKKRRSEESRKRVAVVFNACDCIFLKITETEEMQIARHEVQYKITVLRRHYNVLRQNSKLISMRISKNFA